MKPHKHIPYSVASTKPKSAQPLNEVHVAKALPEYFIKYSQRENAKSDYFNRFSSKLSFDLS